MDGRFDIDGFVIDDLQLDARTLERPFVQGRHRLLDPVHDLDHVGAGLAHRVAPACRPAQVADGAPRFLEGECDIGNIADGDAGQPSGGRIDIAAHHHLANPLDVHQLALGTHHIAPLAFVQLSRRDIGVGFTQYGGHVGDGQPVSRHALGIDGDAQLELVAAAHIDQCHARDALQPVLDDVLDEVAIGQDVALVPRQRPE